MGSEAFCRIQRGPGCVAAAAGRGADTVGMHWTDKRHGGSVGTRACVWKLLVRKFFLLLVFNRCASRCNDVRPACGCVLRLHLLRDSGDPNFEAYAYQIC